MRKALCIVSMMLSAALASSSFAAAPSIVGKEAPDFVLRGLDGRNLRLSEFRGQVVLVNFWTRSDGDSRQQMPALDRINTTFAAAMSVSYPLLFETGTQVGKDYFLQKMPMTILVDRSGVVRYAAVGFKRGDERTYVDQIRGLLRE
jgi:peroxiredoxin